MTTFQRPLASAQWRAASNYLPAASRTAATGKPRVASGSPAARWRRPAIGQEAAIVQLLVTRGRWQVADAGHRSTASSHSMEALNTWPADSQLLTSCQRSAANKRQTARQQTAVISRRSANGYRLTIAGHRKRAASVGQRQTTSRRTSKGQQSAAE